ncbi:MAG TPA: histidine kinase dimerization/phosphoacceptor domain -containing protein [Anaerolineae bacterium]|nr:histidine kinase dimerization/phosphoacceptor domain -containing protein [Anaerolineae bacterium]
MQAVKNVQDDAPHTRDAFDDLRQRAEDALEGEPDDLAGYSQRDLKELVHDLRVHQVELELQNLALHEIQNELALARDEYAELYDQAPVGYVSIDADGYITRANVTATYMLSSLLNGLPGRSFHRHVARPDQDAYHLFVVRLLRSGKQETAELTLRRTDSSEFRARIDGVAAGDKSGRWRAVLNDVTAEHAARNELLRRTEELEVLNRTNHALAGSVEMAAVLGTALDALRELLGVAGAAAWLGDGPGGEAAMHLACDRFDGPEPLLFKDVAIEIGERLARRTVEVGRTIAMTDVRSTERSHNEMAREREGQVGGVLSILLRAESAPVCVLQVMDDQPRAFDAREQALAESIGATAAIAMQRAQLYDRARLDADVRATLLREVNHRVKNNLSAILGLIFAEKRRLGQGGERKSDEVLNDLANRVGSLAAVHTILSAGGWQPLNIGELAGEVVRTAAASAQELDSLILEISPTPVRVTPAQAHHLSLVLCELVTNTAKHGRAMEGVRVHLHTEADDKHVRLVYRDRGPGYPPAVLEGRGRSVGLWLIDNITRANLRGEWTMTNDNGAVTELCFPLVAQVNG